MLVNVPIVTYGRFTYKSNNDGVLQQTVKLTNLLDESLEYYKDSFGDLSVCSVMNTFAQNCEVYLPMFDIRFDTVWLNHNQALLYNARDHLQSYYISKNDDCQVCNSPSYVYSTISHAHKSIRESSQEEFCTICEAHIPHKYYRLINRDMHNTIMCIDCKKFSDNMPAITYTKMRKHIKYTIYYQDTSELKSTQSLLWYNFNRIVPLIEYLPRDVLKFIYSILVLTPTITNLIV